MLKLIGCMILISCSCMLGSIKASSFKARRHELENIIEVLRMMDIEITYKKEPLARAFLKLSSIRSCWFTKLLDTCGQMVNENKSLDESWEISKIECSTKEPLINADIDILDDLIIGLGKCDSEGQHRLFEPAILRFQTNLKEAYLREQKQGKMYVSLGAAAGVVTSILLL